MNGRDFSAELFGPAPAPAPSGRDFSAELFGSAPAPAPVTAEQTPKLFMPPDQQDPQAALRRAISDREAVKRELARLSPNEIENRRILETELVREQQRIDYYRQKVNEPAAVTPAVPAPVRPSVQPKPAVTPFEGSPIAGDDLVAAIQPIETPAKPTSVLEGVKAAPLPTEDPLLRPEFVDQVQKQFNVMPEAQRNAALAEMAKRTDMYGRAARVIAGRYEAMDKAKSTVAREQFDPRLEVQAQRLIKQGASAETAESIARQRGLTVGPGRDLAQIGRDIAGEEAAAAAAKIAEEMEGAGFLSRVGEETLSRLRQTSLGAAQVYADITGDTDLQKDLSRYRRIEEARGEAIPKGESQFEKSAQQALATLTGQAPMIVLSALTGTALPVLGQAAFDSFMQSYGEARNVNKSPAEAASRAGLMAVAEVVFERYGLTEQLKAVKGAIDRIPTNQLAGYLTQSLAKELPAEQATTLSQFLTDKLPQIGLQPDAGLKEYFEQAGETLRQTVLQSGAAGATIFGAGAGARAVLGPREEEAKFDAEAIARSKGFLAGAPAAPEAKPEVTPEAKPTPAAEAPAEPIVPPTEVAEAPKEEPSKIKEMFGELEAVSGLKPTEEAPTEAPVAEPAKAPEAPEVKAEEATKFTVPPDFRYLIVEQPAGGLAPISKEDADFELEVLESRATKGKLTPEVFAQSEIGKRLDTSAIMAVNEGLRTDPVSTIQALRAKINESAAAPEVKAEETPVAEAPLVESAAQTAPPAPVAVEPKEKITVPEGFEVKEGRKAEVVLAARALKEGRLTKDEYDWYVNTYAPIEPVLAGKMEAPINDDVMYDILVNKIKGQKKNPKLVNAPIADGTRVGLRMDIPALNYGRKVGINGSVVSIHEGKEPDAARGKNISYKSTGHIKNVVMAPRSEEAAFKVARMEEGKEGQKKPQQTMEGEWVNTSPEETLRLIKENFDKPEWVQVSLDPLRHSYFYARDSLRPVLSADEALQVGRFVLVKNPVYGDRQQFLYNIESTLDEPAGGYFYQSSPSYKREAKKLTRAYEKGKITSDEFARRMGILKTEDEQLKKESVELVRGADHLVSKLRAAVRKGELSPEAVQLAQWFIDNNPQLVDDLAISLTSPKQGGVGGMYESFARLMTLIKFKGDKNTVVHEILHHLERMMPTKVQQAIKKEWTKRLLDAQKQAKGEKEKFFFDALINHHFDEGVIGDIPNAPKLIDELNNKGFKLTLETPSIIVVKKMLQGGIVPIGNYQYYSPSEFWAVNGSNIVRGRYEAIRGGVLTRLKNWLRELGQKIKAIFGLASDAPIIRALDSLAKSDGQFVTDDLLDQAQTLFSVKPSKKQTDTPEFKRWFGDSKVVDENGEPMIMYHGTSKTEGGEAFTKFDTYASEYGLFGQGSYFTDNPEVASSYTKKGRGPAPTVYPVYLSIKNPIDMDAPADAEAWGKAFPDVEFEQEVPKGGTNEQFYRAAEQYIIDQEMPKYEGAEMMQEALRSMGHDGVTHIGGGRVQADGVRHRVYIAFDPEQVKSSTGNIGTFDPNDPNILYSIEPEAKPAPREAKPAKTIEPSKIDRQREAWTIGRDELGRPNFGPGAKAYDVVARLANIALDKMAMKPISPELGRAMRNMKVQVGKAQKTISKIGKELSKLSPQERALISDVIEGEVEAGVTPPQHVLDYAAAMVEIMTKQGQELVRLGMLSQEAYNRWENKYLPRFYQNSLGKEAKAWATATKQLLMRQPVMQGIKGKQLKSRGKYATIYTEDLADWQAEGWEQRDPDFDPKTSAETIVWRDYTREEREQMGEIRDAMFRFVMGYNASQRDIALGRLYENLAENYASKSPIEGYVQVPDTQIEGTQTNRYGKLGGLYVPREIMDHLVWNDKAMSNGLYKLYQAGLSRWKEGKTVLNPVTHANNVFSNFTMAHFAGVSYWDVNKYAGALRDFVTNNDMLKEAEDIGLFTGTFSQAEMVKDMPPELKQLANMTESQIAKYGDRVWDLMALTVEWSGKKYGARPIMKWAYENEDFFFRYVIYRDARNRGMDPENAREYSNNFIFTYDDLPAGARVMRDALMPFFSYTYKVVPVLTRTALEYPWRYAAPIAATYTANAIMYSIAASLGGDEDDWWGEVFYKYLTDPEFKKKVKALEAEEREKLPPWLKGTTMFGPLGEAIGVPLGTEKAIRLGMDDVSKMPLFIEIGGMLPGGNILDALNNTGGVDILGMTTPANPVFTTLMAMYGNKDLFYKKNLVEETDTDAEKAAKRTAWLWKQWAPAIAVGNYHFDNLMQAAANLSGKPIKFDAGEMGVVEYTGKGKDGLDITPKRAVSQMFGVKVRPYDFEVADKIDKSKKNALLKDLARQKTKIDREEASGYITPETAETRRERLKEKEELIKDGLNVEGKPRK